MKRKGISPLIAAVLMIAFTMAIASLFSGWIQQTQADTQEDVTNQKDETLRCNNLGITISQADAENATIEQTRGDNAIGNISVTWKYSDGTSPQQGYVNISSPRGVGTSSQGTASGNLEAVTAASTDCSSATDEYTP